MEDVAMHYEDLRDSARAFLVSYHRDAENYIEAYSFFLFDSKKTRGPMCF